MKKLRALLYSDFCDPESYSIPLVGWSQCEAMQRLEEVDAHVVTDAKNRESIERFGWREGKEFTAIDVSRVSGPILAFTRALRKMTGLGWTLFTALSVIPFAYFEMEMWRRFGGAIERGEWDVVHRVTSLSPTTPSVIAGACHKAGVPFVWGPINGGAPWPAGFHGALRAEGEYLSYVRDAYKLMPYYRSTRRNASAIIIGSQHTWGQMAPEYRDKSVYIPENAVDPARFTRIAQGPVGKPLRVAFVGRLVPYKGADMLVAAAAPLVRAGKVIVDIIGDGPEMGRLREMVDSEGLASGIKLDGWVEHSKLQQRLVQSDVFAFPSIREFGGGVVLEAMALGLVPLIADYAGPAELVTDATGYRVPVRSPDQLIGDFRAILDRLADDPSGLRAMGERARERVFSLFTWDIKARQVLDVYRWVTGAGAKPDFGMPFPDAAAPARDTRAVG